jgi:UV DNA damage endonuclease
MDIRLGLCCINTDLRDKKPSVFSSRTIRLATLETKGLEYLQGLVIQNIKDTIEILKENVNLGIHVFRISSEIFPHITNEKCGGYSIDFAIDYLKLLGNAAKKYNQRITAHPGQYNVLGSPREDVVNNTVKYLNFQAEMFDIMEMNQDSVMVIHGGGLYGNKEKTIERWVENFNLLSKSAQKRLVLENCEKCFNVQDCLDISYAVKEKYGFHVPVVVDSHHYDCYNLLHPEETPNNMDLLMPCVIETWDQRDIRMKVHISEQGSGKIGHHSDYIYTIPEYFLNIYKDYENPFDIMVEAKAKEKAVLVLHKRYEKIFNKNL